MRTMVAVIALLLVLAGIVAGLVIFRTFTEEIAASNQRLPRSATTVLARSRSFLSQPQLMLVTFDGSSLFVRTDPNQRLISILSVPSSAYGLTKDSGLQTVGGAYALGGSAGVIRFARSVLGLRTTHVALIEPGQIAPLIEAVGGVRIRDRAYSLISGRAGNGEIDLNGPEAGQYLESAGPSEALRPERERVLLEAIVLRLMNVSSFSKLLRLAHTFPERVATDLSTTDAVALALLRLRIKSVVECGTAEGSSLASSGSERVMRQFLGKSPTRARGKSVLPRSGCRATSVGSAGVPAAIISVGSSILAVWPFLPAIAMFVIALDLIMLVMLLRIPHRLVSAGRGIGQARRNRGHTSTTLDKPRIGARYEVSSISQPLVDRLADDAATAHEIQTAPGQAEPSTSRRTVPVRPVGARSSVDPAPVIMTLEARPRLSSRSVGYVSEQADRFLRKSAFGGPRSLARRVRTRFSLVLSSANVRWGIVAASLGLLIGYLAAARP
jgi:anionic cell wall polymer biosynthesis LytR-Cps2A-Psr (LCP) family protein